MSEGTPGPIHPGEILAEEFLKPLGLSQNHLGLDLGVPPQRISEIIRAKRVITFDTALRLARYFGTTAQFWLNLLQSRCELGAAKQNQVFEREEAEVGSRSAQVFH